jgi:hypothetical protein
LCFLVVALAAFAVFSLWDERNAKARLLRERLSTVEKAAERQPSPELAILRDEMLSEIPALDNILAPFGKSFRATNDAGTGKREVARRKLSNDLLWSRGGHRGLL